MPVWMQRRMCWRSMLLPRSLIRTDMGLSAEQVRQRKEQYGPNQLPEAPPRSAWRVFFSQFKSILILILIGAALLAALMAVV